MIATAVCNQSKAVHSVNMLSCSAVYYAVHDGHNFWVYRAVQIPIYQKSQ